MTPKLPDHKLNCLLFTACLLMIAGVQMNNLSGVLMTLSGAALGYYLALRNPVGK